ncbi:MAG: hypothetical protein PHX40_01505 [Bacilli bacterium]|nr:hypothetical protein [Bacilli bacterium]
MNENELVKGMTVNFNEPTDLKELVSMFENGIYPVVFKIPVDFDLLKKYGNKYVQVADSLTYGDFYILELDEKSDVRYYIPNGDLESLGIVNFVDNDGKGNSVLIGVGNTEISLKEYIDEKMNEVTEGKKI